MTHERRFKWMLGKLTLYNSLKIQLRQLHANRNQL